MSEASQQRRARGRAAALPARITRLLPVALTLLAAAPLSAQTMLPDQPFGDTSIPGGIRGPEAALPRLVFRLHADIALPGPLPGDPPRLLDGTRVEIPVAGAIAVAEPDPGAAPRLRPRGATSAEPAPAPTDWVLSPNGRRRFRTTPEGRVLSQKCCAVDRRSWYRVWKLRIPGGTIAPPLVTQRYVFIGALDNQLYALRVRNGHRVWVADVGARISTPMALATIEARVPGETEERLLELVLAVPDGGSELIALDSRTGQRVAGFRLAEDGGRLVGAPLALEDGRVVVARQKYDRSEASLIVLELTPPAPQPAAPRPAAAAASAAAGSAHDEQHLP